ncbi:MAG: tRNA lysidine(34) synthetase TilS [Chloroflexi bacterium]|nr:tRNA lysidine(34) synthetase TilS [Chloroflexota bacterium]
MRTAITKYQMFRSGDLVVVGVSGGPDSVVLLHALTSISRQDDIALHVAHLNHMLRGEQAAHEAEYVELLAKSLGWPVTIAKRDVPALRRQRRTSLEEAARIARYTFFAELVKNLGARCVAIGHTADDQVETVMMHWLRGSGLAGLRGMLPVNTYRLKTMDGTQTLGLRVVRPMLEVTRFEVEDYCQKNWLQPCLDSSNLDLSFRRNRIRHEVIPYLETLNPRLREGIIRMARLVADDYAYIQEKVSDVWNSVVREGAEGLYFDLSTWLTLSSALRRHLLKRAVAQLRGDLCELSAANIEKALELISEGRAGSKLSWPHGLNLLKLYKSFLLCLSPPECSLWPQDTEPIVIPGETRIGGTNWQVSTRLSKERCSDASDDPWHADLDYDAVGYPLTVRRREVGDRFQPLGMQQEKKLQDFFVDAKIPRYKRDAVPILVSPKGILWVVGLRIDERVKVTEQTRNVLCIRFAERQDEIKPALAE